MAHTRSQDLEAHFNTLHSNFTETQQEVRQLNANISTINKNMHSSTVASIKELKQDITTQLESITTMICTKLHIPTDIPLSDPPLHTKGETSSHS
jgi:wobble nucleotide-excising tRNase